MLKSYLIHRFILGLGDRASDQTSGIQLIAPKSIPFHTNSDARPEAFLTRPHWDREKGPQSTQARMVDRNIRSKNNPVKFADFKSCNTAVGSKTMCVGIKIGMRIRKSIPHK